jgi:ATP-binding cassette subfamily B protein RaxB
MAGLLAIQDGSLIIDGQPVTHLGASNYRKVVACVLQDDRLFAGTIAENISGFDPEHDDERVHECARLAAVADEINAMPMADETLVGDMGSVLSGGQRQRLFLARALYRQPRILFLDEATSHLDEHNERKINDALSVLSMTRVIVAHRASSIALADKIFGIESGTVREVPHKPL